MSMTRNKDLLPHIDRLRSARVLCIGDVMLDHYVYGDVTRVSPEAPIPVLCVEREMKTLGGAGSVLRNLRALGVTASCLGCRQRRGWARRWAAAGGAERC
jgi:D-beta-D-heptose 7-phosphate kinase / D-beta-D-heptose 1-phosphate adenosyltransferase